MSLAELADRAEARKNVLGLPIHGDPIFNRSGTTNQWGEEELAKFLRPLLASDDVVAIRWRQYTPYFNDGDICEFSAWEPTYRVDTEPVIADADDDEYDEYDDGFLETYDYRLKGGQADRYVPHTAVPAFGPYGTWEPYGDVYERHPNYYAMVALNECWGHFETLCYEKFGDHAIVTVWKDRIEVEYYEHD